MNILRKAISYWWPSLVVLFIVLWLTLAPHPVPETDLPLFPGADKLVHLLMMGGLTSVAQYDASREGKKWPRELTRKAILRILIAMLIFCAADEYAQSAMHFGRTTDIHDLVADWVGVLIASFITPIILRRFHH